MVGVEHVVISAYNPQANGLTERFNKTFCEALRKHAEADPVLWPNGYLTFYWHTEQEFTVLQNTHLSS